MRILERDKERERLHLWRIKNENDERDGEKMFVVKMMISWPFSMCVCVCVWCGLMSPDDGNDEFWKRYLETLNKTINKQHTHTHTHTHWKCWSFVFIWKQKIRNSFWIQTKYNRRRMKNFFRITTNIAEARIGWERKSMKKSLYGFFFIYFFRLEADRISACETKEQTRMMRIRIIFFLFFVLLQILWRIYQTKNYWWSSSLFKRIFYCIFWGFKWCEKRKKK